MTGPERMDWCRGLVERILGELRAGGLDRLSEQEAGVACLLALLAQKGEYRLAAGVCLLTSLADDPAKHARLDLALTVLHDLVESLPDPLTPPGGEVVPS